MDGINKVDRDLWHWQFLHCGFPPETPRNIAFIPSTLKRFKLKLLILQLEGKSVKLHWSVWFLLDEQKKKNKIGFSKFCFKNQYYSFPSQVFSMWLFSRF